MIAHGVLLYIYSGSTIESSGKKNENNTKNAQGVVLMAGASRILEICEITFAQGI